MRVMRHIDNQIEQNIDIKSTLGGAIATMAAKVSRMIKNPRQTDNWQEIADFASLVATNVEYLKDDKVFKNTDNKPLVLNQDKQTKKHQLKPDDTVKIITYRAGIEINQAVVDTIKNIIKSDKYYALPLFLITSLVNHTLDEKGLKSPMVAYSSIYIANILTHLGKEKSKMMSVDGENTFKVRSLSSRPIKYFDKIRVRESYAKALKFIEDRQKDNL